MTLANCTIVKKLKPNVAQVILNGQTVIRKTVTLRDHPWAGLKSFPAQFPTIDILFNRVLNMYTVMAGLGLGPQVLASELRTRHGYIVMELLPTRLSRANVSGEGARAVQGLVSRAHDAGYIHGDLDRRNIMIHADGTPRLIDMETMFSVAEVKEDIISEWAFSAFDISAEELIEYEKEIVVASLQSPLTWFGDDADADSEGSPRFGSGSGSGSGSGDGSGSGSGDGDGDSENGPDPEDDVECDGRLAY